ncbi:MAG: sigma-70 family RNA polymerase sigma factor [Pirellulaceae bacterium]|nr:sigma-70 family RNA polymerase sigma factor [Pirellulaceae bacterium]
MLNFETTQWTLVLHAGNRGSQNAEAALASLCQKYWQPLFEFARRRMRDEATASDAVQEFITCLIEKNYLASVDVERGKFRSFLLTAFKHFLSNQYAKAQAKKRGGEKQIYSLAASANDTTYTMEPADSSSPDKDFQQQWARTLLSQVMKQLETEYARQGKSPLFSQLKPFISMEHQESYQDIADNLDMKPAAVRMAVSRLRERYRHFLRQEIAHTVANEDEIEEEIHDLFLSFQS